jgi:Tfp pilus assembly protein PilN
MSMTTDTRRIELRAQLEHLEATQQQVQEVLETSQNPATREQAKADLHRTSKHIAAVRQELEDL